MIKKVFPFIITVLLYAINTSAQIGVGTTTPNSTLDVRGSISASYRPFAASTTAATTDNMLVFTGTSAATLTLPDATACAGRLYWIKNTSSNSSTLTVATTSSQTIDGLGSWTLTQTNKAMRVVSNGTNWLVAAESLPGNSSGTAWIHGGNNVASLQNIGTTSNYALPFITNNTEKMRLTSAGSLGIGTSSFNATNIEKLLVDAGTTTSVNAIVGKGSINSYLQLNIQNLSAGTAASSDVVATANNGDETTNYVDMGINGSGYTGGVMGSANDAYLYNLGQNFLIGTGTASKSLAFMTGGTSQSSNERMRITGIGDVGIGITAPNYQLHMHKSAASTSNWMQITNNATGTGGYDGFFYGVSATGQPQIWGEGDMAIITGSGTTNKMTMTLTANGNVGISTSTFNGTYPEKLIVDAGSTGNTNYQNVIVGKGNTNSYAQLNIQNNSAGTAASSDVVATADNGNETVNYIDMGVNGSGNTATGVLGGANTAYLYSTGNDFSIGNGTSAKNLTFFTTASGTYTERMRIDGSGNVGIGIINPSYKLHINGTNPLFLNGVQTGAGTDSLLTIINGVVKKLHPSALTVSSSNAWALIGNASTNPSTNFIGTTDAQALVIKENNTQVGRFEANSIAFGNGATTNNSTHSYAFGSTANVGFNKTHAYAIGSGAAVNADSSFSIGDGAVTNGTNSVAIGNSASANNSNSVAIGKSAVTAYSITDALAIGTNATANNSNSIAIGSNSTLASKTVTNAANAIAIGTTAVSNSASSIAIGTNANIAYSINPAVAIGNGATVSGHSGIAIGNGATTGSFSNAMALGAGASATSTATNSTAIGYNASATLANEIILGDRSNTSLSVGIGTESFSGTNREKLLVDAGTTTSVNAIVGKGSIDSYLQLNIQNNSAGASASSDVVATANNGNETSNYVDMGINGGSYTGGIMGAANDGYLYTMGNNFLLGTGNASKSLIFMTGGTAQSTNERMRIDGTGNVGIGTNNPGNKLEVNSGTGGVSGLRLKQLPSGAVLFMGSTADVVQNNSNFYFDGTNYRLGIAAGTTLHSTLQVGGSVSMAVTTKTAGYTASSSDYTILCNNTSGAITIALPAASGCSGRIYIIKKVSGIFNNVVVDPNGSETIDGNGTRTLTSQYESIMIQSDGTNWYVL